YSYSHRRDLPSSPPRALPIYFLVGAAMRNQFAASGHVDAIHIGIAHRWRGRSKKHLVGACRTRHFDDLAAGGAAYDGVVDDQHRSEEHTSELQSRENLVWRLL